MNFEEWKEQERKKREQERKEGNLTAESNPFFGRENELAALEAFLKDETAQIFGLYGVPAIGKTTLIREFLKGVANYEIQTVEFRNPENPGVTLDRELFGNQTAVDWRNTNPKLIIIENFEEALKWEGDRDHLHEIRFEKIKQFLDEILYLPSVKLILASRFQIKMDFLPERIYRYLILGGIDRTELFKRLNEIYRNNKVSYEEFEQLCDKFNDHVWLIELAMQNKWLFEDVLEAVEHPQSITQKLWDKLKEVIKRLTSPQKTLLCAFSIVNPISENELENQMKTLPMFQRRGELEDDLWSLRKKLLTVYNVQNKSYELNPFLREVCFTFLQNQQEMEILEDLPYFNKAQKPEYDRIKQAQEKGDYGTFYRLIHDLRKKRNYEKVHEILDYVFENDLVINRAGVLNEKGITYKWQKNYDEAIPLLRKAAELGNIHSYNELAIIYKEQKNYDEAIRVLNDALKINDKDVKALNELAIVYKEQKSYDEAIPLLRKAAELGNIHSYNELAIIYKEQKNYDEAIPLLIRAAELGNIHSYNELAIIYKEQKNYGEAIRVLNNALKINDKDVKALNVLAIIYKELGNFEKALDTVKKGLKIAPNDKVFQLTLSRIQRERHNQESQTRKNVHPTIQKALNYLLNANYSGYFEEMDKVVPDSLQTPYNEQKRKFISGDYPYNFYQQLQTFAHEVNKVIITLPVGGTVVIDEDGSIRIKPNQIVKDMENHKRTILFIAANPSDETRLQTDKEHRIIKAEIGRGAHRDAFEFLPPQFAVTITELLRAMNSKPNIVHFAGHGETDGIVITTDDNNSQLLPIPALQRLFRSLKDVTEIVILNSCYSAEQARLISEFGMYVVGNNLPIGDDAAISFAKGLYNGLSEGKSFEDALNDALIVVIAEAPDYLDVIEVWKDGNKLDI